MKGVLFTFALTYGGAVASLFNAFHGLLIYICFGILRPHSLWHWSLPEGNFSRIVAIAFLLGWANAGFGNWWLGRARVTAIAVIAFMAWATMSAILAAQDQDAAFAFLETMAKILLPVIVGLTLIDSARRVRQLAWVIVASQAYVAFELNLSYFEGANRLRWSGFAGMDNNSYAIALVTGAGLTLFVGLDASKWWQKLLAFFGLMLMVHAVFFSFSRGGMLALIVTAGVGFWLLPKQPKHYLAFLIVILLGLRLAGAEVRDRFASTFLDEQERDASAQSRLDMWEDCWDVMQRNPIFGIGPNQWGKIAPEYGWPEGKEAHSLWMQTGAELGFLGLGILLSFYGVCAMKLRQLTREKSSVLDPSLTNIARGCIAALAGYVVAAQFVSLEALEIPYYVVLLGAGLLKVTSLPDERSQSTSSTRTNWTAPQRLTRERGDIHGV